MSDGHDGTVPGPVAVCVLRLERRDGDVLVTVTVAEDVTRDEVPYRLVTLDLERALAVVRTTATRLVARRSPGSG
jgi:hypothetical protein